MSAQAGQLMGMCLIFAETGQRMSCFPFKQKLHWKSAHVLVQFVRFLHHLTVVVVMVLVIVNVLIVLHPCPPRRRPHFRRPCPRRGCCCFCNRCQARRSIKNKETKNWRIRGVGCECGSICIYMHLYCLKTCHGELLVSGLCVVFMSNCVVFPVMMWFEKKRVHDHPIPTSKHYVSVCVYRCICKCVVVRVLHMKDHDNSIMQQSLRFWEGLLGFKKQIA